MKKLLLLSGFVLSTVSAAAQPAFEWLRTPPITMTLNADYIGYNSACDASGNVFYAGFESNQTPYGSEILGSLFVKKYDAQGNELYSKTFAGQGNIYSMVSDSQGNLVLAIGYQGSIIINNLGFLTTAQGIQPMLVKLNAEGNMVWHFVPQIEDSFIEQFRTVTVDASDNIYIGYGDYSNSYVTKFTPSGSLVSTITQTQVKTVTSLSVDNEGNIYTAGSCAELQANFNGADAPINLTYNVYVAKYNASGVFQWVRYVEDVTCPFPLVKARTPDEVYFSSALFDAFSFGNISSEGPGAGGEDFFISKLNAIGTFQWIREVPGSGQASLGNRNTLELDGSGNIYFSGKTRGTISWNANQSTQANGFHSDALVLEYNPQGDVLMAKTIEGSAENRFDAVSVSPQGDIFLAGLSYGAVDLDGIIHDEGDNRFTFLTKISGENLNTPQYETRSFVLYPNPANNYIRLSGNFSDSNATLLNALGQKIKTVKLSPDAEIPVSDLSQGVYFLKAQGLPTRQFFKL